MWKQMTNNKVYYIELQYSSSIFSCDHQTTSFSVRIACRVLCVINLKRNEKLNVESMWCQSMTLTSLCALESTLNIKCKLSCPPANVRDIYDNPSTNMTQSLWPRPIQRFSDYFVVKQEIYRSHRPPDGKTCVKCRVDVVDCFVRRPEDCATSHTSIEFDWSIKRQEWMDQMAANWVRNFVGNIAQLLEVFQCHCERDAGPNAWPSSTKVLFHRRHKCSHFHSTKCWLSDTPCSDSFLANKLAYRLVVTTRCSTL